MLPSSCTENLRTSWKLTGTKQCCTTFSNVENMENVLFNNVQLDHLARSHPSLGPNFYCTVPSDRLPDKPGKCGLLGYIVNTDPQGQRGRHWIARTQNNVCELMDSYALPLETYLSTRPLQEWLNRHWK